MSTPQETCQINELKLGYSKCTNQDISVVVIQPTKKGEEKIPICRECWKKLAKNDKFYHQVETLSPSKDISNEVLSEEEAEIEEDGEENEADEDGPQE